jgi:hypothetical protein
MNRRPSDLYHSALANHATAWKNSRDLVRDNEEKKSSELAFIDVYSSANVIYGYSIFKLRITSFNFCLQFAVRQKFRAGGKLEVVTS